MGYENDPYQDEGGDPMMDFVDDFPSDRDEPGQDLLYDGNDDGDGWDNNNERERSPIPVCNDSKAKPQKRLIRKSSSTQAKDFGLSDFGIEDGEGVVHRGFGVGEVDDVDVIVRDDYLDGVGERKREKGENRISQEKKRKEEEKFKLRKSGGTLSDHEVDPMMKELWDSITGSDSEAEEGEEDEEIQDLLKMDKKKNTVKRAFEISLLVELVMAQLEEVVEKDAELNRQQKSAKNKLKKLPLLTDALSKKQLQLEFLDHGVLNLLKNWLEPLPDGSLPNINVRTAILKILTDFPIDLDQSFRREQLKNSGLGKVIMFLSKSNEETTANRKLAKDLADKWVDRDEIHARAKQIVLDQRRVKAIMKDNLTKASTRGTKGKTKFTMATKKDNLKKASTRGAKGKTKFTMAAKKDNLSKARTWVTKGISIDKIQSNSSSFKGKKEFSKAIGKGKEITGNPSPQHVPNKSCELNLPDSDDDELLQEAIEFMEGCHDYKVCCDIMRNERNQERVEHRPSPQPPLSEEQILEQDAIYRKLFKSSEERRALAIEFPDDFLVLGMSPIFKIESEEEPSIL